MTRRTRVPGPIAATTTTQREMPTKWKRFFLNTATLVDGASNLTINSADERGTWSDITRTAQNDKDPKDSECYYHIPTNPLTGESLVWGENWTIQIHGVVNQWGSTNGYNQSMIVFVCNDTANDSAGDFFFGAGPMNSNGTKIFATRIFENDASSVITYGNQQLSATGWTTDFRFQVTLENTNDNGMKHSTVEYRDSDNTPQSGGNADLKGYTYSSGVGEFQAGDADPVNLGIYWPGTNSSSPANDLTNLQFKLYYTVSVTRDPVISVPL